MPLLDLFWSMLWFFLFFIWIWLLISLFADIFRSDDLSGWGKAGWTIFIIVLPFLGVLVYLIARGGSMTERAMKEAAAQERADEDRPRDRREHGGRALPRERSGGIGERHHRHDEEPTG